MSDTAQWVIWNGSLGVLDMVAIGCVEHGPQGRTAHLAAPYDMVGPFSLDALEAEERIAFGACLVMSRGRWRLDQVELRAEGIRARQALMMPQSVGDGPAHRRTLELPEVGPLIAAEINAAFRRLAKAAHPDAGGTSDAYRRICEARDALLAQVARAS